MLKKFKRLLILVKNAITILKVDDINASKEEKSDIYIFGNGSNINKLDIEKVNNKIACGSHLAFCNGFLAHNPFDLRDGSLCHYYISDPLIERFFDYILSGGDVERLGTLSLNKQLFSDTSPQAYRSLVFDAISFKKAINMEALTWHVPFEWKEKTRKLGVKNIKIFNNFSFPCKGNLFFKKLCIKRGFLPPFGINPLGPAVINMAIMNSLYFGYENVYIMGHSDEHNTCRFRLSEKNFEFSYKYFWDINEYWYKRDDTLLSYMNDQVDTIKIEKEVSVEYPGKIQYLADSHLHLYFICLEVPDVFK